MERKPPSGPVEALLFRWESLSDLASDLGIPYQTVRSWGSRNRVPPHHRAGVIKSAEARGVEGVTLEALDRAHADYAATLQRMSGAA